MNDYVVGRNMFTYTVAKFAMGSVPEHVYYVGWYATNHMTCTCMGGNHPDCKHRRIVREYILAGFPIINTFWIGKNGEVNGCYAHVTPEWKKHLLGITDLYGAIQAVAKRRADTTRDVAPKPGPKRVPNKRSGSGRVRKTVRRS